MDINTALTVFLGLCAAITAIGSAATYIGKATSKITEPDKKQDERIQKCEDRIRDLDGQIGELREYLKKDKNKIVKMATLFSAVTVSGGSIAGCGTPVKGDIYEYKYNNRDQQYVLASQRGGTSL